MTEDHYAGAADGWATGASLVYQPIAEQLVQRSPHPLAGRLVLDAGAGTGVTSVALAARGARPVAVDLSPDMLGWQRAARSPAVVADIRALPLPAGSVDDAIAAFVLNHLPDPVAGLAELARVTTPGGTVLANVFANTSHSDARDVVDEEARRCGWEPPAWYLAMKGETVPLLGTAETMEAAARAAGLAEVEAHEVPVDVGVDTAEKLVTYRLGQAHSRAWLATMTRAEQDEVRRQIVDAVRPAMQPYRPVVVFLVALRP